MTRLSAVVAILMLMSCAPKKDGPPVKAADQQPPTASEVFRLRSECAKLGEVIKRDNKVGADLSQDIVTHYDPKTNRCYAEMTVQDPASEGEYMFTYLYDAQTKEQLAFATKNWEKRSGWVSHGPVGYDAANIYIANLMDDHDHFPPPRQYHASQR